MDRSSVAYLVKQEFERDEFGVQRETLTERMIYCDIASATRNEVFEGGRNGFKPELKITMFQYEYENESLIRVNNILYSIYRTYITRDDSIELYCERRKGNEE